MDHCLRGIKQHATSFQPPDHLSITPREQQPSNGNCRNVYLCEKVDPMYKGINQDIKWITKIKRKRSLKTDERPYSFQSSNIRLSSSIPSYSFST